VGPQKRSERGEKISSLMYHPPHRLGVKGNKGARKKDTKTRTNEEVREIAKLPFRVFSMRTEKQRAPIINANRAQSILLKGKKRFWTVKLGQFK